MARTSIHADCHDEIGQLSSYIRALEAEVRRLRGEFTWALERPCDWQPKMPDSRDWWQWREHMARDELMWTMADSKPFPMGPDDAKS